MDCRCPRSWSLNRNSFNFRVNAALSGQAEYELAKNFCDTPPPTRRERMFESVTDYMSCGTICWTS
ncbi:hypothetical protein BC2230_50264 [Burkholderia cepacia]